MSAAVDGPRPESGAEAFWRLFIAIALDEPTRRQLLTLQHRWRAVGADVGWVRTEGLHLTLIFLGETPVERVPEVAARMEECAGTCGPFEFEVIGWGVFGRPERPRVLWAGVRAPPQLAELQGALVSSLRAAGFPIESRPFVPHITLGRVRSGRGLAALTSALRSTMNDTVWGRVVADRVLLMRSRLNAHGPVYTVAHESALKGRVRDGEDHEIPR
ncbi:MAG: RNA 2',3'-cyclic phosphodiesterase [Kiritimatiellae bacterium]|nr:RNA 2',3'-cyclic phosphodiesterase [Kiritimatiellia bacterium]